MSSFIYVGLLLLVIITSTFMWKRREQKHPGFGAVLALKQSDGTVWIVSRLLYSPAHHHGIQPRSQLVSMDGVPMSFQTGEEFLSWFSDKKTKKGDEEQWVTKFEGKEIIANLVAENVAKDIPVYWSPNATRPVSLTNEGRTSPSLEYCKKTGEYVQGGRLTVEAVKEAYFH